MVCLLVFFMDMIFLWPSILHTPNITISNNIILGRRRRRKTKQKKISK